MEKHKIYFFTELIRSKLKLITKLKHLKMLLVKIFIGTYLTQILTLQQPYKNGLFIILFLKPVQMFGPEFSNCPLKQ